MDAATDERRRVKSLETLFSILKVLQERNGAGVTEVAEETGRAKSTVHRYLSTLEENGFVVKEDEKYHIGLRVLTFGEHARTRKEYYQIAKPKTEQLARRTGERVQFIVDEHGRGVYIYRSVGDHGVRTDAYVGKRTFLHTTAAGKAILSYKTDAELDAIIDEWGLPAETQNTITSRDALLEDLETTRERGYALNREEHVQGLWGIAAPILDEDDSPLGALSIGGPKHRIKKKINEGEITNTIVGETNELELNIKYA